jgi:hypothetical protein
MAATGTYDPRVAISADCNPLHAGITIVRNCGMAGREVWLLIKWKIIGG